VGYLSLSAGALGLMAVALPHAGKYLAIGLGMFAVMVGLVAYRRASRAALRIAGAAGVWLGVVAVALGATATGATIAALDQLEKMFR
jgi:hypothetical protein